MFDRLRNSWQLVKASWAVLQSDKELLLFPILSGVVILIISIVFLLPAGIFLGLLGATSEGGGEIIGIILSFLFYLVSYTIAIYFNVALVGAAMIRLDGGDPTVSDGLRIANSKLGIIVQYAAISATIGIVLNQLRERGGIVGSIVASLSEFAWNVATFLVVPVLVVKDVGPLEAVKESVALLKKTWGEQLAANFGLGAIFTLLFLLVIFGGGAIIIGLANVLNSGAVLVIGLIALFIILVLMGVISGALSGIYTAVLYRYAETGVTPDNFDIAMIRGAFVEKPKRKLF